MPYKNIIIGIYCIKNIHNNKAYIGQSNNIMNRWCSHRSKLNKNKHGNKHLQFAWNKYGESSFEFLIIEECDISIIDEREKYWISYYNSTNICFGYNNNSGGKRPIVSEKTKMKISLGRKGIRHSEEAKAKISLAQTGRKLTDDWKKHISEHHIKAIKDGSMKPDTSKLLEYIENTKIPIKCYDKNGYVCDYPDIHTAAIVLNVEATNICKVLKHKHKTCGGYTFSYLNEDIGSEELLNRYKKSSCVVTSFDCIEQIDENNNVINTFKTIKEASRCLNLDNSTITKVCKGKLKSTKGYRFRYG